MFLCYYLFVSRILLVSSSLEKEKQINYIFNQSAQNVLNSFLTKGEVVFQFCVRNCCYFLMLLMKLIMRILLILMLILLMLMLIATGETSSL